MTSYGDREMEARTWLQELGAEIISGNGGPGMRTRYVVEHNGKRYETASKWEGSRGIAACLRSAALQIEREQR